MAIEIFVIENVGFNCGRKGFKISTLGAKLTLRVTFYEENYVSRPKLLSWDFFKSLTA